MGADNQAERVLSRIEFRKELAEVFYREWRKHVTLAPPWNSVSETHRSGTIAGIRVVLDEIKREPRP
jgi:hypothetical protein